MKNRNVVLSILLLILCLPIAQPCFGMNWTQINTDGFGDPDNRLMSGAYFNQKMYVATGKESDEGIAGTPIKIFEYDGTDWRLVNTDGFGDGNNMMGDVGMAVYQNRMYVGTKNDASGTQIWSYDGSDWTLFYNEGDPNFPYCRLEVYKDKLYFASGHGDPPGSRNRVMAYDGVSWSDTAFDDSHANEKIDDMAVYDDKLYLTTYNEGSGFQIWAYDESSWELISAGGLGDTNNHVGLGMSVHDNRLLVCTGNMVTGGQLWAYDGQDWAQLNSSGFGDTNNALVIAHAYEGKLYAGTFNHLTGGELWLLDGADWTRINSGIDFSEATQILAPGRINSQLSLFVISDDGLGIWTYTPPLADAGIDQIVIEGASVSLDGTGSSTTDGNTYRWVQESGIPVTLSDATTSTPSFNAPEVNTGGDTMVFRLTVTDNGGHATSDHVTIDVNNQCTITTDTQGNGTILLDPAGSTYAEGTSITLNAEPADGYQFDHWEGGLTGTSNPVAVTLTDNMHATAVFIENTDNPNDPNGSNEPAGGGGGGGGGCFIVALD